MGAACCVASREKTITNASNSDVLHRNIRHSPSWSFRWDHRGGRVAGEETTSVSWFSDAVSRNGGSESKLESAYASEEGGSPLEHFRRRLSLKSEGTPSHVRTPASDQSVRRNASMDASLEQSKELTASPTISYPSPAKFSGSLPSTSSPATSPLSSSQGLLPLANSTPLRWPRNSPGHHPLLRQPSDSGVSFKSSNSHMVSEERPALTSWSNDSCRASRGGSSDSLSMNAFSDLVANSHRERWSFESESFGFNREKMTRASSRTSSSPSVIDSQSCGVCLKPLTERSLWSSQKIFACNELSVVAVLMCGHVYHAECLEHMTPEINKYDPGCPICTFGEKQTHKLCEKALKAEMELKARNRRSRNRVVDLDGDPIVFEAFKGSSRNQGSPKLGPSSSMKPSSGKPFLKRHFSFGSKNSRPMLDNQGPRKKGLFWAKSSKM